jgi:hypothetical protein
VPPSFGSPAGGGKTRDRQPGSRSSGRSNGCLATVWRWSCHAPQPGLDARRGRKNCRRSSARSSGSS